MFAAYSNCWWSIVRIGDTVTEIKRKASGEETLKVAVCPCCKGEVCVTDCCYTSFNPGNADCLSCLRRWDLGYVNDLWDAGLRWNTKASELKRKLELFDMLGVKTTFSISRCFATEDREDEAAELLKSLREHVIGAMPKKEDS